MFYCLVFLVFLFNDHKEVRHHLWLNELAKKSGKVSQSKVTAKCAAM